MPSASKEETEDKIEKVKKFNVFDPKNHEETAITQDDLNKIPLSV